MGEYRKERLLLEGQVKLIIDPMEFRMALWINGFGLSDAVTGEEIIPLCHSYNLEHVEEAGDQLEIDFRIYPEGHVYYHVAVDPFARTFTYKGKVYSTDGNQSVRQDIPSYEYARRHFLSIIKNSLYLCPESRD